MFKELKEEEEEEEEEKSRSPLQCFCKEKKGNPETLNIAFEGGGFQLFPDFGFWRKSRDVCS